MGKSGASACPKTNIMKISLIISTYNAPDKLLLCLESVRRQIRMPDEVVIADDGSTDETKRLIEQEQANFPCPVRHVWHEDNGFRLSEIRNKAIIQASGDYIIQVDGDIILSRHFVEDHEHSAVVGTFCCGSRCLLTQERTLRIVGDRHFVPSFWSSGLKARENALRFRLISPLFYGGKRCVGCNMAFWRKDLMEVNGYDEDIRGWGAEDSDIGLRLRMNGVRQRRLKFCAICFHIWHYEEAKKRSVEDIQRIMRNRERERISFVSNGISRHL